MNHLRTIATALILTAAIVTQAQCSFTNTAFKGGEDLHYQLYFNWKFVWLKAGTANFNIQSTTYLGKPAYRCHLITRGNKRTDKFFVMRDTLLSYVTTGLAPLYYRKGAQEGKRYNVDEVWYSYPNGKPHLRQRFQNYRGEVSEKEYDDTECIYDMVSMLLRARSFDPSSFRKGQKLKFPMASGTKVRQETLIYRGEETFTMESGVTYDCLVFSFVEYEGSKEREVVTFYVTNDMNHMPVRLDLFLKFGTAKAFLTKATGVRNPQTSIRK